MAHAAQNQWNTPGGKRDRGQGARAFTPASGKFTSGQDFDLFWPEESSSTLVIEYHPNRKVGLTDPRYRRLEYDLETGSHEVSDHYPTAVKALVFSFVGLAGGVVFLLLRLGLRPLQKSDRWDWRMAAKKLDDEIEANELMARMRNREA